MPFTLSCDAQIYYEEEGSGPSIVFVHEFGSDMRSWKPLAQRLAADFRCITFNARGYPPSDVKLEDGSYGLQVAVADLHHLIGALRLERPWVVGASMGAFTVLEWSIQHPGAAQGIVLAGLGTGASESTTQHARTRSVELSRLFETGQAATAAALLYDGPTRRRLRQKNPTLWSQLKAQASDFSSMGAALTARNCQGKRKPLSESHARLGALGLPVLLAVGDEDAECLRLNCELKSLLPGAGLWVSPRTGHLIHAEEPDAFYQTLRTFISSANAGDWIGPAPIGRLES